MVLHDGDGEQPQRATQAKAGNERDPAYVAGKLDLLPAEKCQATGDQNQQQHADHCQQCNPTRRASHCAASFRRARIPLRSIHALVAGAMYPPSSPAISRFIESTSSTSYHAGSITTSSPRVVARSCVVAATLCVLHAMSANRC